jgi:hypothetical protein
MPKLFIFVNHIHRTFFLHLILFLLLIDVSATVLATELRTTPGTPKIGDIYSEAIYVETKRKIILPDGIWEVNNSFEDRRPNWHAAWRVVTMVNKDPSTPFSMLIIRYFLNSTARWDAEDCEKQSNPNGFFHETLETKGSKNVCSNFYSWTDPSHLMQTVLPKEYKFHFAKAFEKLKPGFFQDLSTGQILLEATARKNGGLYIKQEILIDAKKLSLRAEDFKFSISSESGTRASQSILYWRTDYVRAMSQQFLESGNSTSSVFALKIPRQNSLNTQIAQSDVKEEIIESVQNTDSQSPGESTKPAENKTKYQKSRQASKPNLQATVTEPDSNGTVLITIHTNADTSSLTVNGNEEGGRTDGHYVIKRIAKVGQDTEYKIVATDVFGNTGTTLVNVARQSVPLSRIQTAYLKPENIKPTASRDAVAIIVGIQNYKRVPKAEFANNDAKEFYEYAIRALGIKPEKIKMLLDEDADDINIVKAFGNWLPIQVNKDKTDIYVFYSGHGLPSPDGKSLYLLPHGVDKELLSRTAVSQSEIIAALTSAKPKSVTMFIDACYSGQTRDGDLLIANAKPVSLKSDVNSYPSNFTVITASANDQISSSSPDLKHGIFSFYLMKGMEGDADANQDGKITIGEMQDYLADKVARQAMTLNRKQTTQLIGDTSRVLVSR